MLMAFLAIVLLYLIFSGSMLRAQSEIKPDFDFTEMNEAHSQVMVTGENYSLNQEQENAIVSNPIQEEPQVMPPEAEESIIEEEKPEEKTEEKEPPSDNSEKEDNPSADTSNNEMNQGTDSQNEVPVNQGGTASEDENASGTNADQNQGEIEINKKPIIESSLRNEDIIEGGNLTFTVRGRDYRNEVIDPFNYEVKLNGSLLYSTGVDDEGYVTYRSLESLPEGENEIAIYIEDKEGNSSSVSYRVISREAEPAFIDEYASLTVDARVLGLGILLSTKEAITKDESAAHFVDRVLWNAGFAPDAVNNLYGYYLARLNSGGIVGGAENIKVPDAISNLVGELDYNMIDPNSLGERDLNGYSGWVYLYNYSYMGVGLSNITLRDGDEIIICFTLANGAEYDGTWYYYGDW